MFKDEIDGVSLIVERRWAQLPRPYLGALVVIQLGFFVQVDMPLCSKIRDGLRGAKPAA